jgi:hypothetical protein
MRSKTLISYQKGYCGQPADIEAMKPREARAYCLGVGHVAAGALPFGSGAEVLAALSTRRWDVDSDGEAATWLPGDIVKRVSAAGPLTQIVARVTPTDKEFKVSRVDPLDNTIAVNDVWVNSDDFVLVRRAAPEPQR